MIFPARNSNVASFGFGDANLEHLRYSQNLVFIHLTSPALINYEAISWTSLLSSE